VLLRLAAFPPGDEHHDWIVDGHQHGCSFLRKANANSRRTPWIEHTVSERKHLPAHHAFSRSGQLSMIGSHFDLFVRGNAKNICSSERVCIAF
jgi:hypothetical protein